MIKKKKKKNKKLTKAQKAKAFLYLCGWIGVLGANLVAGFAAKGARALCVCNERKAPEIKLSPDMVNALSGRASNVRVVRMKYPA